MVAAVYRASGGRYVINWCNAAADASGYSPLHPSLWQTHTSTNRPSANTYPTVKLRLKANISGDSAACDRTLTGPMCRMLLAMAKKTATS
jgi:hypothetical protein